MQKMLFVFFFLLDAREGFVKLEAFSQIWQYEQNLGMRWSE